jgi:capsule polysaccharide export protein KpsC/LpsZ
MRFSYTPLESLKDFVYFPFHVPGDMALTLRSPEYFDQLSLIEYMLKVVPFNHMVAVKEHPAQIGGIAALRLKQLLERYDNLVVINPRVNNYDVINKANLIVSINSKSGAEAGLLGKPSLVLGEAFYKDSPLVERVSSISDLKAKINESLDNWKPRSEALRDSYFQNVWDETYVGELYIDDNKDVKTFSKSIGEIVANLSPNS